MKSIYGFIMPVVLLLASAAAAQEAQPSPRNDSISGHVINESGQPVPGAYVSVVVMGGGRGRQTSTDNEGSFKVDGLEAGIYRIYSSAAGYSPNLPLFPAPAYRPGDKAEVTLIKGGVIAGSVTNLNGEPVVNIQVRAFRIRDPEGNKITSPTYAQLRFSDDRGYYRLYGLMPGTYVIAAGGPGQGPYFGSVNQFANDAMTYAASATRDTAAEIIVRSNQETTADIRYRGEPGHVVSGKVSGPWPSSSSSVSVELLDPDTQMVSLTAGVNSTDKSFQLNGVSDGDYEVVAIGGNYSRNEFLSSVPRRLTVRADVTGLDLTLTPLSSIDAHVNLEPDTKLNCGRRRESVLREIMVTLQVAPKEKSAAAKDKPPIASAVPLTRITSLEAAPNEKGDLSFRNLLAATYLFEVRLPAAGWYLRTLSVAKPDVNIARNGLSLKPGEKLSTLTMAIAEGGAGLRGRVTVADGQSLPGNLRIYLVPTERENSDNPLRFFEDAVAGDGTFAVGNIAPGKYWLVTELAERVDANTIKSPRVDGDYRAKVVHDASTLDQQISFKPCERAVDYEFRYAATKP